MTSASSTTKKHAGFMPLFAFQAKQFWTTILLFTIILFFVLPVPILMTFTDNHGYFTASSQARDLTKAMESWSENIRFALVPILSAFAVVISCARFSYLKNKVSIDFYHSVPIKRSQLYLTQLSVGAISLIIPLVINMALTLIIIASNGCITSVLMTNLLVLCGEVLCYTAFFYALSVLVGMISGLTAVQLALTAVAMFIIPAVYASTVGFVSIFNENMWEDWYLGEETLEKMTPVFRFLVNEDTLYGWEAIVMLLAAITMFVGAFFIYRYRKSERAGTPVVFKPLAEVIKYVLVYIGTLLGGLLFYLIMDSFFWTVFGLFCGTVLVFMLVNTILNKTAKSMFKGWKGLCAYGVVVVIGLTVLMTNAFGINSSLPSPAMTSRVEVNFTDTINGLEFRDSENIEALYSIYTDGNWYYTDELGGAIWNYETFHIQVVFYPKIGFPIAKEVRIYNKSDFVDEFRTILDSEEFKEQYSSRIDQISFDQGALSYDLPIYYFDEQSKTILSPYSSNLHIPFDHTELISETGLKYGFDALKSDAQNSSFDYFQNPALGTVRMYGDYYNSHNANFSLYPSMSSTLQRLIDNDMLNHTYDELIDKIAEYANSITIYKRNSDAYVDPFTKRTITDKARMKELLRASANPFMTNWNTSDFTFVDTEYYAVIEMEMTRFHGYDLDEEIIHSDEFKAEMQGEQTEQYSHDLAFLAGKVPAFVYDMLG